jgi:hypothetical protein
VDTSTATFEGADENSNVDALQHAKRMRSLTELRGGPTVVVLCHPTKNATADNLIPRGGRSFVAEIDGNLCARKSDSAVELHWAGKFRGMDFAPITFRLDTVTAQRLKDNRGRSMPTVMATPMDEAGREALAATERRDEDQVLRAIDKHPGASSNELAKGLDWKVRDGKPYGVRVRRAAEKLAGDGLILKHRGAWVLGKQGEKELNNLDSRAAKTLLVVRRRLGPEQMARTTLLRCCRFCRLAPIHDATGANAVPICFDIQGKPYRMGGTCVSIHVPDLCSAWGHSCPRIGWNRTSQS